MEVPDPVKFMESKGMTVSFLTEAQVKAFADATAPVLEKWTKELGTELVDKARADMGQ
jgi:TRAP-type C4-dicarboxylate transport system substrate-binding protein